jgi:thiosulfate/3-mercaptopyruvate sulfurtransferase
MPNVARDPVAEFKMQRIPGARFFNLDEVTDKSSLYPHMLPSAEIFAEAVGISLIAHSPKVTLELHQR